MTQENKSSMKITAIAIICVILAASTIGASALYLSNQTQITEKEQTIASLNQQIADLQLQIAQAPNITLYAAQIASLRSQLSSMNESLASVYSEYVTLQNIVDLSKAGTLYNNGFTQDVNSTTTLYSSTLVYAGYITVQATANVSTTYAQVSYTFNQNSFSYNQTLGTSGTALFAVLPGAVNVVIGNVGEADANSVNATVVYHY